MDVEKSEETVTLTRAQYIRLLNFAAMAYDGFGEDSPGPSYKDLFDVLRGKPCIWNPPEIYKAQIEDALKYQELV